jgi:hypothetical protein
MSRPESPLIQSSAVDCHPKTIAIRLTGYEEQKTNLPETRMTKRFEKDYPQFDEFSIDNPFHVTGKWLHPQELV